MSSPLGRPLAPFIERWATVFLNKVTNTVLIGIGNDYSDTDGRSIPATKRL